MITEGLKKKKMTKPHQKETSVRAPTEGITGGKGSLQGFFLGGKRRPAQKIDVCKGRKYTVHDKKGHKGKEEREGDRIPTMLLHKKLVNGGEGQCKKKKKHFERGNPRGNR